ncbi:MAG: hypothetical protein ACKO96_22060, partial [Flammeovirgaceae bacterium]
NGKLFDLEPLIERTVRILGEKNLTINVKGCSSTASLLDQLSHKVIQERDANKDLLKSLKNYQSSDVSEADRQNLAAATDVCSSLLNILKNKKSLSTIVEVIKICNEYAHQFAAAEHPF